MGPLMGAATAAAVQAMVSAGAITQFSAEGFRVLPIGLCEDYPEETRTLGRAREDLELLRSIGVRHLRVSMGWDGIETRDDVFDWAFWDAFIPMAEEEFGIDVLPYFCYTPEWAASEGEAAFTTRPPRDAGEFGEFVRVAAGRYGAWIGTWELWNEPDNPHYWNGTVEEFAGLVNAGSAAVRSADPGAAVVLGGIAWNTEFVAEVLQRGGVAASVDIVNAHSYLETWTHERAEELPEYLGRLAAIVERYGEGEPLWAAEVGYSTYRRGGFVSEQYTALYDYEHTDEYQDDHLLKTVAMIAAEPAVELMAWYEVRDLPAGEEVIGDVNNRHLGVFTVEGEPKPASGALAFARELFSREPFRKAAGRVRVEVESGAGTEVRAFEREDGGAFVVMWLPVGAAGEWGSHGQRATVGVRTRGRFERGAVFDSRGMEVRPVAADSRAEGVETRVELRGGGVRVLVLKAAR